MATFFINTLKFWHGFLNTVTKQIKSKWKQNNFQKTHATGVGLQN